MTTPEPTTGERAELLGSLAKHRSFLRYTVRDLTDEQARTRSTVSELCLSGLIKHVTWAERQWTNFILHGPAAMSRAGGRDAAVTEFYQGLTPEQSETLTALLTSYAETAHRTEQIITDLPDLEVAHPLPEAPWFEPGARWTARRVLLHLIGETAQHAGHADILREAIDGAKTMG
jgi:uncharacterized damage-inducible protein DinB